MPLIAGRVGQGQPSAGSAIRPQAEPANVTCLAGMPRRAAGRFLFLRRWSFLGSLRRARFRTRSEQAETRQATSGLHAQKFLPMVHSPASTRVIRWVYQRVYHRVSSPVHPPVCVGCFVSCFPATVWDARDLLRCASQPLALPPSAGVSLPPVGRRLPRVAGRARGTSCRPGELRTGGQGSSHSACAEPNCCRVVGCGCMCSCFLLIVWRGAFLALPARFLSRATALVLAGGATDSVLLLDQ